jgi:hypothetical protein
MFVQNGSNAVHISLTCSIAWVQDRRHEAVTVVTGRLHAPHVRLQQMNTNCELHEKLSNFTHLLPLKNYLNRCQSSENHKNSAVDDSFCTTASRG